MMLQVIFILMCLAIVLMAIIPSRLQRWTFKQMDRFEEYCKRAGWPHGYFVGMSIAAFFTEQYVGLVVCLIILVLMHFMFKLEDKEKERKDAEVQE